MKKLVVLLFLAVFGCHTATDNPLPDPAASGDDHFISAVEALRIAGSMEATDPNGRGAAKPKTIKNHLTIDDADDKTKKTKDQPVFYIVNYEEGGYKIISADDRLEPVLADVPAGPGIDKSSDLPGGLLLWMKSTKDQIQNIRKARLTKKANKGGRAARSLVNEKLPLLRTRWRQAGGKYDSGWPTFNQQIPWTCQNTDPNYQNGNAVVGCVGLAVAQIIRYWGMQNPSYRTQYQYNWSAMPVDAYHTDASWEATRGYDGTGRDIIDGKYATDEIARLMADAAREVHTSYGCNASGAAGTTRVVTAFRQYFGYSSASYSSTYRPHDVVNNLNMGWPVILGGYESNFLWWGYWWGSAHSWVCDGYRSFQDEGAEYCYYDEYDQYSCYTPVYYRLQLHMNWGWGGSYNGWFSSTYFGTNVNGQAMPHNYQCNLDALLDIHP